MRIALSTLGKFHTFDLARQLQVRGMLSEVYTAYPRFKLKNEGIPPGVVKTFPWLHAPYMVPRLRTAVGIKTRRAWELLDRVYFDRHVARNLSPCDVFIGLSGSGLESGKTAKRQGAKYVCDRGSSHIRTQNALLVEEHRVWGIPFSGIDPRIIDLEEAEYAEADCITVPSEFNLRTFIENGIESHKIRKVPYGVDLQRFRPTGQPDPSRFDIVFAGAFSLRKGLPYLLQAYKSFRHPRKSLTIAGTPDPALLETFKKSGLWSDDIKIAGHVPQHHLKDLFSRSHVMVLASIEEGLALVQAQAMACGCPVIATRNTGAEDLFDNGREGFIVPMRDDKAITERLTQLASDGALLQSMRDGSIKRVEKTGGWADYGRKSIAVYESLLGEQQN